MLRQQKEAFDSAVREAAGTAGGDVTSKLAQLADLKAQGVLTDVPSLKHKRPRFWLRADVGHGVRGRAAGGGRGPTTVLWARSATWSSSAQGAR